MKIYRFILIFIINFFFFTINPLFSKELKFNNIIKLNLDDIQSLTKIDLSKDLYNESEINEIISDLYQSELIYDIDYQLDDNFHIFFIDESKIIENIYFNGNIRIKDDDLISLIETSQNSLLNKNKSLNDIKLISNLYINQGYEDINVSLSTEKVYEDRVNLIFNIYEGNTSKIIDINFIGNNFFSNKFLSNIVKSESKSLFSFISGGSNFDKNLFKFDRELIINLYKDHGFFDVEVNYQLEQVINKNYELNFYIVENDRAIISKIDFFEEDLSQFPYITEIFTDLTYHFDNEKFYFDKNFIDKFIDDSNQYLITNNIKNFYFDYSIDFIDNVYNLKIKYIEKKPKTINKINIFGNSITKDITIRSKIDLEPGDLFIDKDLSDIKSKLSSLKYVNNVEISSNNFNDTTDILINLDENKKTGSFLFGGSISGDTGLGAVFSIKDYNVFGTGNEINASINYDIENTLFKIVYTQYPFSSNSIKNNYLIFNEDNDYTSSYGYKVQDQGFGYSFGFDYSKETNLNIGFEYSNMRGHSASKQNNFVTDNIGNFQNIIFRFGIDYDTTNDFLYPTNGIRNNFSLELSPDEISDDKYIKSTISSSIYFEQTNKNFLFFINNLGSAESFSGNLKTKNTYSLGGLNFKGFNYKGIGPFSNDIYLGGNKFFTSSIGYGGTFLFDKKDNINIKLFATTGSVWDSDYSNNDFELRSSIGLSMDFLTLIPISISYAVPIQKEDSDKLRKFNFTIGTSFWLNLIDLNFIH